MPTVSIRYETRYFRHAKEMNIYDEKYSRVSYYKAEAMILYNATRKIDVGEATHPCIERCKYASENKCDCECQGKNHGLGNDREYKGKFWTPPLATIDTPLLPARRIQEMPLPMRDCPYCGLPFPPRKRDQRFCSPKCRSHSYYIENAERCRQWTRDSRARDKAASLASVKESD